MVAGPRCAAPASLRNLQRGRRGNVYLQRTVNLLRMTRFNLIEAIIIAGWAVNAEDGYIYMRAEYSHLRPRLLNAIKQAEENGFLGKNISVRVGIYKIHLYTGAGAYVCGEGTALIRSMEGKAGRPRMKTAVYETERSVCSPDLHEQCGKSVDCAASSARQSQNVYEIRCR